MQLEFGSGSIWAMFEEAVSEYSQQMNHYNMKNWMWNSYGTDTKISGALGTGSFEPQTPSMGTTFMLSEQYGQAAHVGGNATMYSASITLSASKQSYDLASDGEFESVVSSNDRIEVQRVFNHQKAAISKFYDPYVGSYDQQNMIDNFGFGEVSPAVSFILRPIHQDISRANSIETSDLIRKSAYSFEIINNKMRIFPRPETGDAGQKIWFQYFKRSDLRSTTNDSLTGKVSDPSNVPYKFITYSEINAAGRQWIKKYTLALSKELLGIIRSKYASMPLPNGEVSLDGEALKGEGREEKDQLLTELKEFLDSVSLREQATAEQEVADANQGVLNKAPLKIYIG
tara:strand:- start:2197 stop:3225 length:1029 start_codon:yes stop_codon:yes gene_type:complete